MAEGIQNDDAPDASVLIGVAGMTPDQFFGKVATLGDESDFELTNEDDAVPDSIVMRADYDNIRAALAAENEDFARLTDANRTIADAMLFLPNAARIFARLRGLEPSQITVEQKAATDATLIFGLGGGGL